MSEKGETMTTTKTGSGVRSVRSVVLASFAMSILAFACSTPQQRVLTQVVPSVSPPAEALTPENGVSAQGSIRAAVTASRLFLERHGDLSTLTETSLVNQTPELLYVPSSRVFNEVSYNVRGDAILAVAAMSPSGACFGALDDGSSHRPAYSHTDIGQLECNAKDVPYPIPGF